ncbi:hypothetical protein [Candidatus Aciduliprofundum boonei]|uniref:Uncharacterized protein n=1 Tax=Aciduliprofundum boonei (strain DSM 19572 / T469) TaxID=439481 RepID=B5IAD3_ACIB4|nr:hypothetical protein [Candidatus Aciduliprofundum boonei]ADD08223.1 hypothetical protein Aboo_0412 [Aciduliprofundum boonei T469]EDY36839.1 hypothetical protein ABOONEI_1760 [Aciduliprofundum boonei T469]HII55775.1 hypothetical protein [Candidatus Aciduliprofundum boonei]
MKMDRGIGESIEFGILLSILTAGVNALWGIFFLPWGIIGIIFSLLNIFSTLLMNQGKNGYLKEDYEYSRKKLKMSTILNFIFGWILLGIYTYRLYISVDNLIIRSHLIREVEEPAPIYASPKIPRGK